MKNSFSFTLLATILILGCLLISCAAKKEAPIQALLITGGGWHEYDLQEALLTEGLSERIDIEWTIVHEGDGEPDHHVSIFQKDNWAEGFDVIIHNTGFGRVNDGEFVEQLVRNHKGTPAVLIHASVHSYRFAEPADPWFEFMGLQSMRHERQREFETVNVAPDHPITNNFPETWMTPVDEVYIIEKIWGDITPLVQAYGVETEAYHPVAWIHEAEGVRVFATSLGHNTEMFRQEEFLDLVANGVLWSVKRLY